jgi:hypothetical protein
MKGSAWGQETFVMDGTMRIFIVFFKDFTLNHFDQRGVEVNDMASL